MRDIANKTDGTGDTLTAGDFNSMNEELENAVKSTDQTLDVAGGPDAPGGLDQLGKAIAAYANAGSTYQDSGSANSYVLSISSNLKSVTKYYDRMSVRFKPGNSNTGSSTVNVNSLGSKQIVDESGNALAANTIVINRYVTLTYVLSLDKFELLSGIVTLNGNETLTNKIIDVALNEIKPQWASAQLVGSGLSILISRPSLTALNGTDVAFIDDNIEELRTYRFNGSTWSLVGSGLSIPGIGYAELTALNGTDVAFIDAGGDELRTYRFSFSLGIPYHP